MKPLRTITEYRAYRQSVEIFNNSFVKLILKFREESKELDDELFTTQMDKDKVLDELSDVDYVLNQLRQKLETCHEESLNRAYKKNEKKRLPIK